MNEDPRIQELIDELMQQLDREPDFDASAFLDAHPAHADALRSELARLEDIDLGFTAAPEFDEVFGALPPAQEQWDARYELRGKLGEGGMGVVYSAFDRELGREVALKVSYSAERLAGFDAATRKRILGRFLAEGSITAQLEHPSIVPIHEAGRMPDGRLYYTMKVVRGRTLADIIKAQREGDAESLREYPLTRLVRIVQSVCDAIEFAHAHGVLHRDLKPQNIMVGSFGEVQVLDWGLAKRKGAGGDERGPAGDLLDTTEHAAPDTPFLTLTGDVLGSPKYMSPEQARGDIDAIDERTDVFGIGSVLYEVLSGSAPYAGAEYMDVFKNARAHRVADPEFLRAIRKVPSELRAICTKAMAAESAERYASVAALTADLSAFNEDRMGTAWRDSLVSRAAKWVRRYPTRALAAGALAILISLATVAGSRLQVLAEDRDVAEAQRDHEIQAGKDRDFARASLGLWNADVIPNEIGTVGSDEGLRRTLDAFEDFGVPLDDGRELDQLAARFASIEAPELRETAVAAVYEFARGLMNSGHAHAWHLSQGRALPSALEAQLDKAKLAAVNAPEYSELWPRLDGLLELIDDKAWRRAVWSEWTTTLLHPPEVNSGWDPSAGIEGLSAKDKAFCGALLVHLGAGARARELLAEAVADTPDLIHARMLRVGFFYMDGDLVRAVEEQLVVVSLAPEVAHYRATLGYMLGARAIGGSTGEDRQRAEEQYRRALELDPQMLRAHFGLLQFCFALLPAEEELRIAREAFEIAPDHPDVIANYGLQLGKNDRASDGLAVLEEGLKQWPDHLLILSKHVDACMGVAKATREQSWLEKAEVSVLHMESIAPENSLTMLTRRALENAKEPFAPARNVLDNFFGKSKSVK